MKILILYSHIIEKKIKILPKFEIIIAISKYLIFKKKINNLKKHFLLCY